VADHVETAIRRAEHRDNLTCIPEHRRLHHRAAALFDALAAPWNS
jgi:hypothetical protein